MTELISKERLAAYKAVELTIKDLARSYTDGEPRSTIGSIADEALRFVENACTTGRLGIEIAAYEDDPDEATEARLNG